MGVAREPEKALKAGGPDKVGDDPVHHQRLLHASQQPGFEIQHPQHVKGSLSHTI